MRVALVSGHLSRSGGGVSAVVEALSRHLAIGGTEIRVFGLADDAWRRGGAGNWRGAEAIALPTVGYHGLGYAPALLGRLLEWKPDIVHAHGIWMHPSRSVLQWSRATGGPYLISPHGMLDPWAIRRSRLKKYIAARWYEAAHLRGASLLHALCAAEEAAIRSYGLRNPIDVVPNGVEQPAYMESRPPPWQSLVPSSSKVMLFLGRLHPKKNLAAFLLSWSKVMNGSVNGKWVLMLAGWDQDRHQRYLRQRVEDLGLEADVIFLGPLYGEEKEAALSHANAFVLPSLSEGVPVAVLEAWVHGLPVLMTEKCNLPEGFEYGAAHLLQLDEEGMSASLGEFLSMASHDHFKMGERGQMLARDRFCWSVIARRFFDIYNNILLHGGT